MDQVIDLEWARRERAAELTEMEVGRIDERNRIVNWLRREAEVAANFGNPEAAKVLADAADFVFLDEHRREDR